MPDDNQITINGKSINVIPEFNGDSGVINVIIPARVMPEAAIFITGMALLQ